MIEKWDTFPLFSKACHQQVKLLAFLIQFGNVFWHFFSPNFDQVIGETSWQQWIKSKSLITPLVSLESEFHLSSIHKAVNVLCDSDLLHTQITNHNLNSFQPRECLLIVITLWLMNPCSDEVSVKLAAHCCFCFLRKREQIPSQEPGIAVQLSNVWYSGFFFFKKKSSRKKAAV